MNEAAIVVSILKRAGQARATVGSYSSSERNPFLQRYLDHIDLSQHSITHSRAFCYPYISMNAFLSFSLDFRNELRRN